MKRSSSLLGTRRDRPTFTDLSSPLDISSYTLRLADGEARHDLGDLQQKGLHLHSSGFGTLFKRGRPIEWTERRSPWTTSVTRPAGGVRLRSLCTVR